MLGRMASRLPKVFVFDLDACVWDPEMYQLWGGGAPFKVKNDGEYLMDRRNNRVELIGDVRNIMLELKTDPKYADCGVAVASCCDEPSWAKECIQKFSIGNGYKLKDVFQHLEIYKANKQHHIKEISRKTGVDPKDMIFFDDQLGNCHNVAKLGVTCVHTPDNGVTRELFNQGLENFPSDGKIVGARKDTPWFH